ncbi:short-chain dehydrogenase [Penicillium hetheringtonii]|uniref:Short-chain dehydrogenase n=1 Tax=Penicillium hetheringtonii TaxID=911720 RepID=A0AAD6DJE0_9EURO|nr:short-chain dehydrogenase [Penicillium hetheringtonii]
MANFLSKSFLAQSFCIPAPTLTEKNLPPQNGRVHLITGGYAGVGKQLATILYEKNAKVFIAGRNEEKALEAIRQIKKQHPSSSGSLYFLQLDLNDLTTIKPAVLDFISRESRLDVLVNNAGVMFPPNGSKTRQDHDMQFGTNLLGPFLLTKLLLPTMIQTVNIAAPNSVRVLWAASSGVQVLSPKGGIVFDDSGTPKVFDSQATNYGQTKITGHQEPFVQSWKPPDRTSASFLWLVDEDEPVYAPPAKFGAYTELFSGWSEEVAADQNITYVIPWGRDGTKLMRSDITRAIKNGLADKMWEWCELETSQFL